MAIKLPSYNEILGKSVRKLAADSVVNDVNRGSVLLTLLEAVATQDFENSTNILSVLEALSIDALKNTDLDQRAADYGLLRKTAAKANGLVDISDTTITKKATTLYAAKLPPVAGTSTLYVNDASTWTSTGTLYIGRGTQQFEGPIPYTAIVDNGSFFTITLGSALQKDHLSSEGVVDAQGTTDRLISGGTTVKIPSNNQNPEIRYLTLRDAILAAGEDTISGVAIVAENTGSSSNAGIGSIVAFSSAPFVGAAVTNSSDVSGGRDAETDNDLRDRIKNYVNTLAKGTREAILAAVIGLSDSFDSKQVASATLSEPTSAGQPSTLYIDDGTGLQPTFAGQNIDVLLNSAVGDEKFLQLANFPVPRPQVINQADGPYQLVDGMLFKYEVDGIEEEVVFRTTQFDNIVAASLPEIVVAINNNATLIRCRLSDNSSRLLIYPIEYDAEFIKVSALKTTDDATLYSNSILKFPTNKYSYIKLYRNSDLLTSKESAANLTSAAFSSWNIVDPGDLILSVDGTPDQDRSFTILDFDSQPLNSVSLTDWVKAFNSKFAGITATETTSGEVLFKSNKIGNTSTLKATGGSYLNQIFGTNILESTGTNSDFLLNRETGNIELLITLDAGDSISAGVADAKGNSVSTETTTGTYDLSSDTFARTSEMVIVADNQTTVRTAVQPGTGNTITISNPSGQTMRILANIASVFQQAQVGDFIYITNRGDIGGSGSWVALNSCGLYKIHAKGDHINNGVDTYVDVTDIGVVVGGPYTIADSADIQVFSAQDYPQLWNSSFVAAPATASLQEIVDALNTDLLNVKGSIFKTNSLKITSTTENDGSIAIPVSVGKLSNIIGSKESSRYGNPSHIATKITQKDLVSGFRRTIPVNANVWLDRYTYTDVRDALTSNAVPNPSGYSELLEAGIFTDSTMGYDDYVNITSGDNKKQFRTIKEFVSTDEVGTQISTPTTIFDYLSGDEVDAIRSSTISADDSVVFVMDDDAVNKTININFWRTGQINTQYAPSTTAFSANDVDNEPDINFGNLQIWSTPATDFSDYAVWMRSHNWYRTGGAGSAGATILVRANEYGPNGDKYSFDFTYPSIGNQTFDISHINTPNSTLNTYTFASGAERTTSIIGGTTFTVANIGPNPALTGTATSTGTTVLVGTGTLFLSELIVGQNFKFNGVVYTVNTITDNTHLTATIAIPSASGLSIFHADYWRYTFQQGYVDFSTLVIGDIVSLLDNSGVSNANRGQFYINAFDAGNRTLDIYNPTALATFVGQPEITNITTRAEGSNTEYSMTVAAASSITTGGYFTINDDVGPVIFWYNIDGITTQPVVGGASRYVEISTVGAGDSANLVASKTFTAVDADSKFESSSLSGPTFSITNFFTGPITTASISSFITGWTLTLIFSGTSIGGKYFVLYDQNGSVAVWYNVRSEAEPPHGANRAIQVSTVIPGDDNNTVALKTSLVLNADSQFNATSSTNHITVTNAFDGARTDVSDGLSIYATGFTSFTVAQQGIDDGVETIISTSGAHIFPLTGNDTLTISNNITNSTTSLINVVPVGNTSLLFTKATREDVYVYTDNSSALGYGHNPTPGSEDNTSIALYDGYSYVKIFANTNPQFVLKKDLLLPGIVPSIYLMSTAPNAGSSDLGELFKLIPKSIKNIKHQLSHKALSSLPIVADIDIAHDFRRVQVKSKKVGSAGAVELAGGRANLGQFSIIGDGELAIDSGMDYAEVKMSAFPATFNADDIVTIKNTKPSKRLSRLTSTSTVDIVNTTTSHFDYRFNPRSTGFTTSTSWTIVDVSASYSKVAGTVWRWTATDISANFTQIIAGDILNAYGSFSGSWNLRNLSQASGDNQISGFPIVAVDSVSKYIDVVNPNGVAMGATVMGTGIISVSSTPAIRWRLKQSAKNNIISIVVNTGVATVTTTDPHGFGIGDVVIVADAADSGLNGSKTITSTTSVRTFTFSTVVINGTYANGNIIGSGKTTTKYLIEKLNLDDLVRITTIGGDIPYFADCGVAVDDFIVLGGSTFNTANNGRYRVLGVDNTSIIIKNAAAIEELNTYTQFNNLGISAIWTTNSNLVTGIAGTFENLSVGDWLRKSTDDDSFLTQITALNAGAANATIVTLGDVYRGTSGTSQGVSINLTTDIHQGVSLKSVEDITIWEGDSVVVNDSLVVENISDTAWFNTANSGVFDIEAFGSFIDIGTFAVKQYVRVFNLNGVNQTAAMSVKVDGLYILEGDQHLYESLRQVNHAAIDALNPNYRDVYLTPADRLYKMSDVYGTQIQSEGKMGFEVGVTTGIDGYLYYTGIMQTTQHTVDGYEPDSSNFPGQRAAGVVIETLPPLINRIEIALDITTNNGVNLSDVSNDIRSRIISYINGLDVGADVILSEIIARIMSISGIAAATFTSPIPSTERIVVASDQKAYITPDLISLA